MKPVPESPELAALHERELLRKDQRCGAFWGALALVATSYPVDQDEVAPHRLPPEHCRRGMKVPLSCSTTHCRKSPGRFVRVAEENGGSGRFT